MKIQNNKQNCKLYKTRLEDITGTKTGQLMSINDITMNR